MCCIIGGEVVRMSVVVGICGENFFTMVSDGRKVMFSNNGMIPVDEHFVKLFAINKSVAFGVTGTFSDDFGIWHPFDSVENKEFLDADSAANTVKEYFENRESFHPFSQTYIVGGKTANNTFAAYSIKYTPGSGVSVQKWEPTGGQALILSLPTSLDGKLDWYMNDFGKCIRHSATHDEMVLKVAAKIRRIADVDASVNKNIRAISVRD